MQITVMTPRKIDQIMVDVVDHATPPAPPPPSYEIRQIRWWGDPIMAEWGFTTERLSTGNFQACKLWNPVSDFGDVSNWLDIPHGDIVRLQAMQIPDNFSADEKMNWLCNSTKGKIYMLYNSADSWKTAESIKWGTTGLGGNKVQVLGYEEHWSANKRRNIYFAKLDGFRKTDWARLFDTSRPYATNLHALMDEGLVHRCWCANKSVTQDNVIADSPKGIVYSPFWSNDWRFNYSQQPGYFYLPEELLI